MFFTALQEINHFIHRNGNTSVSIRETPSYIENSADATKLKNRDSTFDISDSISTTSLSTVDDNKPFVSIHIIVYKYLDLLIPLTILPLLFPNSVPLLGGQPQSKCNQSIFILFCCGPPMSSLFKRLF